MKRYLSEEAVVLLDFTRRWIDRPLHDRARACRRVLGISHLRYTQRLLRILDEPAALLYDARLVRRLIHLRDDRRRLRYAAPVKPATVVARPAPRRQGRLA